MAYSIPLSPLQGCLASQPPLRAGVIGANRQHGSITPAPTHSGYSGATFAGIARPTSGALPVPSRLATPSHVTSQAVQQWPAFAGSQRAPCQDVNVSMGSTNTRYAKVVESPHRDSCPLPRAPMQSIGNTLNVVSPTTNVMRKVGSPSTAPYQGLPIHSATPSPKMPARIVPNSQAGVAQPRAQAGVVSQARTLGQLVASPNTVSRSSLDCTVASAIPQQQQTIIRSGNIPSLGQATRLPRPVVTSPVTASTPIAVATREASPYRAQQILSPSRSIQTTSPMPTERTEAQSLVPPPLSHRTTSPAPEVQLNAEVVPQYRSDEPPSPPIDDRLQLDVAGEECCGELDNLIPDVSGDVFIEHQQQYVEQEHAEQEIEYIPGSDVAAGYIAQDGILDLSWAVAKDKHPQVLDEEASYVLGWLQSIRESSRHYGLEAVAQDNGIENAANLEPVELVRILLERLLQEYSRNGTCDTFVNAGPVFSCGYKKKLPLHVFPGHGEVPLAEDKLKSKPADMTVLWPWDVKLEPKAENAES